MRPDIPVTSSKVLARIRWCLGLFIIGLVLSGATALPLLHELNMLVSWLGVGSETSPEGHTGLAFWVLNVREGLQTTHSQYQFLAYGTDWLAFGHFVIALFFIGVWRDPVRNVFILRMGLVACVLVIPWALICGAVRGIPFYWQLIDCSFGVIGFVPLWIALKLTRQLAETPKP